jgi:RNA polymerase sigma-70 factor (ECF subfamily)
MSDNQQRCDAELLKDIVSSPAALEEFYRRHVAGVTRFVSRRCHTADDVADAVSATFFAVLFSTHSFDPAIGSPVAWLYSIARNETRGQGRSIGRREALRRRLQGSALLSHDDAERISEIIDAERRVSELEEVLTSASSGELELLRTMANDDLTVAQASSSLGISAATGRKRLERLRRRVTTFETQDNPTPMEEP